MCLAAGERGVLMSELRAYVFRKKATEAETKAFSADLTEPTRRAWLILAREWTKMAEKEEAELELEASAAR